MPQEEVIEPAGTMLARPIVFPPKKDGSLRSFAEHYACNEVAVTDIYLLPKTDESNDSPGEAGSSQY